MAARRTQIYLDDSLREGIDRLRARDGRSMAEIVRDALERYLAEEQRRERALAEVAYEWVGGWAREGRDDDTRAELDRRAARLGY
ncbi:MAG: CopG family transcriptional regulator [Thermoleophilaceae bacterium]